MEDGLYHALPATGALGAMQLKASETWNPKVQRIGIKERGGGVGLQPSCCCFQKIDIEKNFLVLLHRSCTMHLSLSIANFYLPVDMVSKNVCL